MLDVSAQWHNASRQQFRYQAYLYASLQIVPPGLREGSVVTSDETSTHADAGKLKDGISENAKHYATLERNRWSLDGTFDILDSETQVDDWWTKEAVSEVAPTIKFTFDQPYSIPGMYFIWDTENNTWPKSITVNGYDVDMIQQHSITVDDISSSSGFFDSLAMDDIKYLEVVINSWSFDGWRARALEVIFGLTVEFDSVNNGRIISAKQISKSEPLSSKLPTHSLDIEFRNYDGYFDTTLSKGISKYLAQQQVMKIKWAFVTSKGVLEYTPEQVYLTEKFTIPADSKNVTMNLTSRLSLLDSDFYYGMYTGSSRTLKSIAEYVLTNSNALVEFEGQEPWVIPDSFDSIYTTAPIPAMRVNALLQLIALAGCTWLTTRGTDGFIQFLESESEPSQYCAIDEMQELGDPEIVVNDRLRSVSVGVYHYTPRSKSESIGSGKYELVGTTTVKIKYNSEYAINVSASVSGATLVSAKYYASYAILTISANASGATVDVALTGTIVDSNVSYFEVYRDNSVADGKDVTIENSFITELSHAKQVAEYVKSYYLKRSEYKIPYIGYPQAEPGDKINLTTVYGSSSVDIKNNSIDFDGGWSGTMEVI